MERDKWHLRVSFGRNECAGHDFGSVFRKPGVVLAVVRVDAEHVVVETFGMIHLEQVAELVNDHAVYYLGRSQHQQAVEVEIAFGAAAAPSGFLVSDRDSAGADAEERSVIKNALRNVFPGLLRETPDVAFAEDALGLGRRLRLLVLRRLFSDPGFMRGNHALDFASARSQRSPHEKSPVGYFQTDGFSFAAYYSVRHSGCFHNAILTPRHSWSKSNRSNMQKQPFRYTKATRPVSKNNKK